MFIDLNVEDAPDIAFDICVLGAGPAGITLAQAFAETDVKFYCSRAGDWSPVRVPSRFWNATAQAWKPGRSLPGSGFLVVHQITGQVVADHSNLPISARNILLICLAGLSHIRKSNLISNNP